MRVRCVVAVVGSDRVRVTRSRWLGRLLGVEIWTPQDSGWIYSVIK